MTVKPNKLALGLMDTILTQQLTKTVSVYYEEQLSFCQYYHFYVLWYVSFLFM
jgi:hypothetical protein